MENVSWETRMTVHNPHLVQLFSADTPNGMKVACCLEEIIELRANKQQVDYESHTVNIRAGESRSRHFLELNPNGKIPVILDPDGPNHEETSVFESGAILMYLSEKYNELCPREFSPLRTNVMKWMMWGSTGVSSQFKLFGFYYKYCPHKLPYCVERYGNEVKRLLGVLDHQLSHGKHWVVGDFYSIADISIWPWVHALFSNYDDCVQTVFDDFKAYPHVKAWYQRCLARPACQRSMDVTKMMF